MNERLYELAEMANVPINVFVDYPEVAVFANLIVQQCAAICFAVDEDVDNGNIFINGPELEKQFKRYSGGPIMCAELINTMLPEIQP